MLKKLRKKLLKQWKDMLRKKLIACTFESLFSRRDYSFLYEKRP